MDDSKQQKQFETMAAIRAYADEIVKQAPGDIRPSNAYYSYRLKITRMMELQKQLDCVC